ncbi:Hypothetical predicted protein, partial [Mytilus galloprovincialis]
MEARIGLLVCCCCVIITIFSGEAIEAKPQQCNGSKECGFHQCCANKNLKGRKRRSISFAGVCLSYGQYGAECAVKNQNANDNVFPGWCPCTFPFRCIGGGNIENPFGEK